MQPFDLTATIGFGDFAGAGGEVLADGAEVARRCAPPAARRCSPSLPTRSGSARAPSRWPSSWARERHQFGRAIGSFQAVSHRCADMLVALEGARSQVLAAADVDGEESEYLVDLATAAALDAGVTAAESALQIHGGTRLHLGASDPSAAAARSGERRPGGPCRRVAGSRRRRTVDSLTRHIEGKTTTWNTAWGPNSRRFAPRFVTSSPRHAPQIPPRAGVRSAENDAEFTALQEWAARLFEAGYVGADWPAEFGGRDDRSAEHAIVVGEELARAAVPGVPSGNALASHALIHYGTDEQRRKHLPEIRAGRELWCQLFSEPNAGSDLASLRTRAVLDGDAYTVDGQKVWTTDGHWADYGYLLARTDSDASEAQGHQCVHPRHVQPGHHCATAARADGHIGFQRGLLRFRRGPGRVDDRGAGAGLGDRERHARPRTHQRGRGRGQAEAGGRCTHRPCPRGHHRRATRDRQ